MATAAEDDDSWLYASEEPTVDKREEIPNVEVKEISDEQNNNENVESEEEQEDESTQAQKEVGELSGEDQETSNAVEDSDSDDDDDVQVTIKDINATANFSTFGSAPVNVNLAKRPPYSQTTGTVQSNNITTINKTKGLDIDAIGSINGVPSYDFNLDTLEDKPWMKPGADITDYFNYGFNEDTWKSYCERQKRLRAEIITAPGLTASKDAQNGLPSVNENSKYSGPTNVPIVIAAATAAAVAKKAGPPPGRKTCGAIDVIGGGTSSSLASRRVSTSPPKENPIQVMTGGQTGGIPPGITSIPPPGYLGLPQAINMPPPGMMPPGGPPGVSMTMPPMNLSMPPPNFQDPYYNRYPPPGAGNNANHTPNRKSEYDERKGEENYRGRSYDHEGERESWRDYDRKDSPPRSRDGERHRDSGRDRDRGRSRSPDDRRHRDYRDRESDRRDRDRDRRHRDRDRDREDRHRSKRKHYRDDEDDYDRDRDESSDRHRSSRHKRKRSRKDKEDEESDTRDGGETTSATGDDTQAD